MNLAAAAARINLVMPGPSAVEESNMLANLFQSKPLWDSWFKGSSQSPLAKAEALASAGSKNRLFDARFE